MQVHEAPAAPEVVFVVPYRDRERQAVFFHRHMTQHVLRNVQYRYEIVYVHQRDARTFNRGAMKNLGCLYVAARWPDAYREITLVFNDVDTVPYDAGQWEYRVPRQGGVVTHHFGFVYTLGGVVCITAGDFERINGFANFWGWGFEDNALQNRVLEAGLVIDRGQFLEINDARVMQLQNPNLHIANRTFQRGEVVRYFSRPREGLRDVCDVQWWYEPETGMLQVDSFQTETIDDPRENVTVDLSQIPPNRLLEALKIQLPAASPTDENEKRKQMVALITQRFALFRRQA
jgi:hypothetical protein